MMMNKPNGSMREYAIRKLVGQQATDDAAAVERRNRQQVKRHEHQVHLNSRARHFEEKPLFDAGHPAAR